MYQDELAGMRWWLKEQRIGLLFGAVALSIIGKHMHRRRTSAYFLTNYRVAEYYKGLFKKDVRYILLHRLKPMKIKSSFLQKFLFSGTLILEDKHDIEHIELPDIPKVKRFKEEIEAAKKRFSDMAKQAEDQKLLKQVESHKTHMERQKHAMEEEKKKQLEEEARIKREQDNAPPY